MVSISSEFDGSLFRSPDRFVVLSLALVLGRFLDTGFVPFEVVKVPREEEETVELENGRAELLFRGADDSISFCNSFT